MLKKLCYNVLFNKIITILLLSIVLVERKEYYDACIPIFLWKAKDILSVGYGIRK